MQVNPGSKRNWDLIFNLKTILQTCNAGDRETFFKVLLVHPLFSEREREREEGEEAYWLNVSFPFF